jgi:hypothetical protein
LTIMKRCRRISLRRSSLTRRRQARATESDWRLHHLA